MAPEAAAAQSTLWKIGAPFVRGRSRGLPDRLFVIHEARSAWYITPVSLRISIPDEFADVLGSSDEECQRRAREALALELYREGKISLRKMGELAGVGTDFWAADNLGTLHGAPLSYSLQDLEDDRRVAGELLP